MFREKKIDAIIILYFLNLFLYSGCSFLHWETAEKGFWFLRVPILTVLYYYSSSIKNPKYFIALLFYQLAAILFTVETKETFFYGSICSLLFKFFLLVLIYKFITKQNRIAIAVAFVPFFVIYLYIIEIIFSSLEGNLLVWLGNALVTSIIGGVAIINYLNENNKRNYWLLLSSILFIVQIGAYFIHKFYLDIEAMRQIVIFSYGISHFAFYKFLILSEE